jgi:hypothetical protein
MDKRNGKQCRERYLNHLQPNINKNTWTENEDNIIIKLQAKYGNQWSVMTKELPGRSDNAIKNRWHAISKDLQQQQEITIGVANTMLLALPKKKKKKNHLFTNNFQSILTPTANNGPQGFSSVGPMFETYQQQFVAPFQQSYTVTVYRHGM